MINGVEGMSLASILEVPLGALESIFLSNISCIGELESHLVSKNSGFDAARAELESTDRCVNLAEDAVSLMLEQLQRPGPPLAR